MKHCMQSKYSYISTIHPPGPPPSYDDSCRDGGSNFDIFKTLGCIQSGLDEVIELLEPDPPDVPKIQSIFDNLGTLANNLKEEEDADDDKISTDENEKKTKKSGTKSRITSEKSDSSISVTSSGLKSASLRSSSHLITAHTALSSSTAVFSTEVAGLDRRPFFDYEESEDSESDIPDQAAMAFFGDILS